MMDPPATGKAAAMHLKEHAPRYQRIRADASLDTDAYTASCSCGDWEHHRPVDVGNPLDRAEVEDAWFEHANPGVRL